MSRMFDAKLRLIWSLGRAHSKSLATLRAYDHWCSRHAILVLPGSAAVALLASLLGLWPIPIDWLALAAVLLTDAGLFASSLRRRSRARHRQERSRPSVERKS